MKKKKKKLKFNEEKYLMLTREQKDFFYIHDQAEEISKRGTWFGKKFLRAFFLALLWIISIDMIFLVVTSPRLAFYLFHEIVYFLGLFFILSLFLFILIKFYSYIKKDYAKKHIDKYSDEIAELLNCPTKKSREVAKNVKKKRDKKFK